MAFLFAAALLLCPSLLVPSAAAGDLAIRVGGGWALINVPPEPQASLILIPGGDGALGIKQDGTFSRLANNLLVRTRQDFLRHGLATLTVDQEVDVPEAILHMRKVASPVVVAAVSRGSLRVPSALAAKPDAVVLTSAFLAEVSAKIGNAALLPRTLVLHHRQDRCWTTPPDAVLPFQAWGGSRVSVVWFDGGRDEGHPCRGGSSHGLNGLDPQVVDSIARFVLGS
jgi:hypothetical protein